MSRRRVLISTFLLLTAGYLWLLWNLFFPGSSPTICLSKQILHLPCPGCGSTRACISILKGEICTGTYINPNGLLILISMAIANIGLIIDLLFRKNILIWFYQKTDIFLKKKVFLIPFILFETGILVCNIYFKV